MSVIGSTPPNKVSNRFFLVLRSPWFQIALGLLISGLSFYLMLRNTAVGDVKAALLQARWSFVGWAVASVLMNNLVKAFRWQLLLAGSHRNIPVTRLLFVHLAGQALNTIYPGRVGELSRMVAIGNLGVGKSFVLGTLILEKLLDLAIYSLLFFLALLLIPLPEWIGQTTYLLVGITALSFGLTMLVAYRFEPFTRWLERIVSKFPPRLSHWALPRLRSALTSVQVLQNGRSLGLIALWTALAWGTALANNHITLLALDLHLPVTASLLLLIVLQAGVTIPSVPARLGIFEYLCFLVLVRYGVDRVSALSFGFLLHAVVLLPTVLPGLVSLPFLGSPRKTGSISGI